MESQEQSQSLEACLKLLKGERDEQRLAGLLLVTKFCKSTDHASLGTIYNSVGVHFLDRLLLTGMGKGSTGGGGADNRDAYLQLSVTILNALCRVPEIASSEDMVSKIPLLLEVISNESRSQILEECYEFLFLVVSASENGVTVLYDSGGMKVIASQMPTLTDGSHELELAMKLLKLVTSKIPLDIILNDYLPELSLIVVTFARQFAVLHNALKFEALHMLSSILSSQKSAPIYDALRLMPNKNWSTYMRAGIVAILQNRVAPAEKSLALILAEAMLTIRGGRWLIDQVSLSDIPDSSPADRCLMLVLETARVEIAVLLNELGYLKYEASKSTSSTAESIMLKQQNLAISFSLLEKIIQLISDVSENEGDLITESTFAHVFSALNETMGVVLEYLKDAKDHGQRKGADLLASVRIIGSYLAEAPVACNEKVKELLGYMLSVEGEDESSPFYSVCFLLPMLCQITMDIDGCRALVSSGGHKVVVECLIKLIEPHGLTVEDNSCIFLACDTIMNLLLKKEKVHVPLDESTLVNLLRALVCWTGNTNDRSILMMASSISTLIFDYTSEDALRNHPNFSNSCLDTLIQLIARCLATSGQDTSEEAKAEMDLVEIVIAGYSRWGNRFPSLKEVVER